MMICNAKIDGIDRVDKTEEGSLLGSTYTRCPASLQFNFTDKFFDLFKARHFLTKMFINSVNSFISYFSII